MSNAQELSEGWREIKEQKQELTNFFQDVEQQLLSFSRRPAELETKIAQNMLSQVKVGNILSMDCLWIRIQFIYYGCLFIILRFGSWCVGIKSNSSHCWALFESINYIVYYAGI